MSREVLPVLRAAAAAVVEALAVQEDWSLTRGSRHRYAHDTVADKAALAVLGEAGFGVFSEESGLHCPDREVLVVVDPVDGSTNASRGLPWWAVSLCALDAAGPLAAVVLSPRTGEVFEAVRGEGATRNGSPAVPGLAREVGEAIVAFNGWPRSHYGWAQYRSLGAAALDLCSVACGRLDGFVDASAAGLAPWDYMGALLVCLEAGASVAEVHGRELVSRSPSERRAVVAAPTPELLELLLAARRRDL